MIAQDIVFMGDYLMESRSTVYGRLKIILHENQ